MSVYRAYSPPHRRENLFCTIADAYQLSTEKSGAIDKYSARGAELHLDLLPYKEDEV